MRALRICRPMSNSLRKRHFRTELLDLAWSDYLREGARLRQQTGSDDRSLKRMIMNSVLQQQLLANRGDRGCKLMSSSAPRTR